MDASPSGPTQPSRLRLLLDHFSRIKDKRSPESVAHKLNEILLLCVCATIADCDSFDAISDWGTKHLKFLQRFLPFDWGVPSGRWLNIMMNRIDPDLFAACFMDWVLACWPEPVDAIAIDGKTVRRSHDRAKGRAALHLVSAFAANSRLVLGQEAVDDKTNETTAIPVLLRSSPPAAASKAPWSPSTPSPAILRSLDPSATPEPIICSPSKVISRLAGRHRGRLHSRRQGPGRSRRRSRQGPRPHRNPHRLGVAAGRLARRRPALSRRSPLRRCVAIVRVEARTELKDRSRFDTRYYITSSARSATALGQTIRGHWGIENPLRWTLDVTFQEDLSRVRKGHGAQNMALVRKFAINKLRAATQLSDPPNLPPNPADGRPSRPDPRALSSAEKSRAGMSRGSPKSSSANRLSQINQEFGALRGDGRRLSSSRGTAPCRRRSGPPGVRGRTPRSVMTGWPGWFVRRCAT